MRPILNEPHATSPPPRRSSLHPSRALVAGVIVAALPLLAAGRSWSKASAALEQPPFCAVSAHAPDSPMASLADLVESVRHTVVNVEVTSHGGTPAARPGGSGSGADDDELWQRFLGRGGPGSLQRQKRDRLRQGLGSGVVITPGGEVLTNNHVVEGADTIRVKLEDGRSFEAEVLGRDPLTDLALLKLKGSPRSLPVAKLGDSDAVRVGDWLLAIGNPFGLATSVSAGILSARARNIGEGPYDDFLQTDAAINPGNSGGPLFNLRGEVIGINTAIVGGGAGIGFAVPSNVARSFLPQLESAGAVTRGWLGVSVQDLTTEIARALRLPLHEGAVVTDVTPHSPARAAGLRGDDVVVSLDGGPIASASELTRKVALKRPGSVAELGVVRGRQQETLRARLGTRPDLEGVAPDRARPRARPRDELLGMGLQEVDPVTAAQQGLPPGALVSEVKPGTPAEEADLRTGMLIVEAGNKPVRSAEELRTILRAARPGDVLLLRVQLGDGRLLRALTIPR